VPCFSLHTVRSLQTPPPHVLTTHTHSTPANHSVNSHYLPLDLQSDNTDLSLLQSSVQAPESSVSQLPSTRSLLTQPALSGGPSSPPSSS
jgi:hypothetical protein